MTRTVCCSGSVAYLRTEGKACLEKGTGKRLGRAREGAKRERRILETMAMR